MKVMTVFGTRPEGIKMIPVIQALKSLPLMEVVVVNTAQHREMLDQVLELFQIVPDHDLNIMKKVQTPESLTADILIHLSTILDEEKPELVLVHGDTTTTFAAAYAAFLKKIPVGHVEAGLRTHDMYSPFPEEMNRQLVGRIASYHFAATERNKMSLMQEGVNAQAITVVGNTVIDTLLDVTSMPYQFPAALKPLINNGKKTILMTTHRRENLEHLQGIYEAVNRLIENHQDIQVLFPVHKSPIVREKVASSLVKSDRVHILEPFTYETFAHTMKTALFILTDSGGIQEEAPALGVPVLVARNTTERQEGVDAGTLKLVGTDPNLIFREAHLLLTDEEHYRKMAAATNPYGDGHSSEKIARFIADLKRSQK